MDWKSFIASIVGSLAWPAALVVAIIVFKQEIARLLSQVKKLGAAGVSVELADKIQEVREAGEVVELEQRKVTDVIAIDPDILQLAKSFPEAAVLQEYKGLEALILQLRNRLPDDKPYRNLNEVLMKLYQDKYVSQSVIELFQKIRDARNAAAHAQGSESLSAAASVEIIRQIKSLEMVLEGVLDRLPRPRI